MKKITRIVPVVFGALALASCSSDEMFSNAALEATQAGTNEMIAVVDENPDAVTRYGMDNASTMFVWSQGDKYTVFDQTLTKSAEYKLKDEYSGSKAGLFAVLPDQEDIVDGEGKSTARYGVFPFREDNEISLKNHKATLFMTLPSEFAYEKITNGANGDLGENEGSVAPLPLWGAVENVEGSRKITFKMMTGMLKVDLSEIPATYASAYLIVKSAAHPLSGAYKADITKQTAAVYSADAGDVELVKNTDVTPGTTDKQIKVTFNTGGALIPNRVFYLPIPVGTYEAGDLTVTLFGNGVETDLTPEAWKSSEVKIARGKAKKITYSIAKEITANSIADINKQIYNALLVADDASTIEDGKSFSFTVSGAELKPKADDNMLLIPTFNGKNINVTVNIQNAIDASAEALNIAEAAYGDENIDKTGKWTVKSDKTPEEIKDDAATANRTFTVNLEGTTNSNSIVNVLAPTSNVNINAMADNTVSTLLATTANEVNSLMIDVEGKTLTCATSRSWAGGIYVGPHASLGDFRLFSNADVNIYGKCTTMFLKMGTGLLFIEKNAVVTQLVNGGKGDIVIDGSIIDGFSPSLNNNANAKITINGAAETVTLSNKSNKTFTVGSGASITSLTTEGSGEILVQGAVATITNNGSAKISVTGSNPAVGTINNGENGGDVNVTGNKSNLTIKNDSKTANLVVDFANSGKTATITDNNAVMTAGTATGNMTVKNTSGLVTLTNIGGAVVLENCSGNNVINNDVQNGTITLNGSYAATLTNSNSTTATVNTSNTAGIGTPTGAFTFVDAAWNGKAETRNVSGNIYTAAQLAGLTQSATSATTITLMTNIDLNNKSFAGIKQGAMTTFDGANFTISNLNLNRSAYEDKVGLFAAAGTNDLTIQNLTLDKVAYTTDVKENSKNCIGALVGEFNGGSLKVENVTASNVNLDAGNDAVKSNSVAALVGKFVGQDLTFNKTIIGTSTIKGTSSLAGFVGNLGKSNNVKFDGCKLEGLTITVQGTPAESDAATAVAGRVGYLIGGVSGNVANLNVLANCTITPATLSDDQRVAWKFKKRKKNDTTFFWGDARGYLGYCQGTISTYVIGSETQTEGITGTYNIYKGY